MLCMFIQVVTINKKRMQNVENVQMWVELLEFGYKNGSLHLFYETEIIQKLCFDS